MDWNHSWYFYCLYTTINQIQMVLTTRLLIKFCLNIKQLLVLVYLLARTFSTPLIIWDIFSTHVYINRLKLN